ncbi:MAG: Rpn family recombination-promoting nuclease/putative transposase [Chitinispirillales bacterium]|jgi:predicted transposase/invertase (TIGR01784 family)|nr:Rpn family recombination-promoting nuclease/putative transposase [Chitinispirillales bacterium]
MNERTLVSFDWAAKSLLRRKANYVILEGFLTTLLGKDIKIKTIKDCESDKETEEQKYNRVDIIAEEENGTLTIIEIQFTPEIDYFHRMLFGSSKAITDYLNKGMPYSMVRKVYSINIVYFDLGVGKDYIYHGTTNFKGLHYDDELKLSPSQKEEFAKIDIKDIYPEFYLLKVDRFNNDVKDKLDEWMYLFKNSVIEPDFKAPGLTEASEVLEYCSLSPEERKRYDEYVDIRRSNESTVYTAKLEGKEEGRIEGLEKGRIEGSVNAQRKIAKEMKNYEFAIPKIAKITGLSEEEIGKL